MQTFENPASQLFNIVVVSAIPGSGGTHSEVANAQPVNWERANQWVKGMNEGIKAGWEMNKPMRFVSCYMELADCRRPWTPELKGMMERETARGDIEEGRDHKAEYEQIMAERVAQHEALIEQNAAMRADIEDRQIARLGGILDAVQDIGRCYFRQGVV